MESQVFESIINTLADIGEFIIELPSKIINGIGEFFKKLWEFLQFIWDAIKEIPKVIIELLGNLLEWLFVPNENFFNDNIEDLKGKISEKIPYQDYVNLFETIKTVQTGEDLSIDLPEYQIANNLKVKQDKFINFGRITKYKQTWYSWVRGFKIGRAHV